MDNASLWRRKERDETQARKVYRINVVGVGASCKSTDSQIAGCDRDDVIAWNGPLPSEDLDSPIQLL